MYSVTYHIDISLFDRNAIGFSKFKRRINGATNGKLIMQNVQVPAYKIMELYHLAEQPLSFDIMVEILVTFKAYPLMTTNNNFG